MDTRTTTTESTSALPLRIGAVLAVVGTLGYITATLLHGNPPIADPAKLLEHVAHRPWWRIAHLGNILAVLMWLAALTTLTGSLDRGDAGYLGRISQAVLTCATAVFAVYFSIHAFGFSTLADQWTDTTADQAALLTQTNTVLALLGSLAFTAQAMLGLSVLLYGVTVASSAVLPGWLGWLGAVAGAGWMLGALAISFEVIVPFTALAWIWMIAVGIVLWRRAGVLARQP